MFDLCLASSSPSSSPLYLHVPLPASASSFHRCRRRQYGIMTRHLLAHADPSVQLRYFDVQRRASIMTYGRIMRAQRQREYRERTLTREEKKKKRQQRPSGASTSSPIVCDQTDLVFLHLVSYIIVFHADRLPTLSRSRFFPSLHLYNQRSVW